MRGISEIPRQVFIASWNDKSLAAEYVTLLAQQYGSSHHPIHRTQFGFQLLGKTIGFGLRGKTGASIKQIADGLPEIRHTVFRHIHSDERSCQSVSPPIPGSHPENPDDRSNAGHPVGLAHFAIYKDRLFMNPRCRLDLQPPDDDRRNDAIHQRRDHYPAHPNRFAKQIDGPNTGMLYRDQFEG